MTSGIGFRASVASALASPPGFVWTLPQDAKSDAGTTKDAARRLRARMMGKETM